VGTEVETSSRTETGVTTIFGRKYELLMLQAELQTIVVSGRNMLKG
jgi:hypothetical protein